MLDSMNTKNLIKPHMPVVDSDNSVLASVDHLEGTDTIKLAKDSDGQHHYIPLTWVSSVDDKVHLDRTTDQAIQQWSAKPASVTPRVNSVDATVGQPIVSRVMARKHELEAELDATPAEEARARSDIELALSSVDPLLTGDLDHLPATVAVALNQWLERNKHLAERAVVSVEDCDTAPVIVQATTDRDQISNR